MSRKDHEKPLEYNPYSFMNRLSVDKIPSKSSFYQPRTDIKDVKKLDFQLVSREKFIVSGSFHVFEERVKNFFRSMNGTFLFSDKVWIFPSSELKKVVSSARDAFPEFEINEIPLYVFEAIKQNNSFLEVDSSFAIVFDDQDDKKNIEKLLAQEIRETLYPFQRKTLESAVKSKARFLLFDEHGLGKTLQSLAISLLYQEAWPLLVIVPYFLLFFWENEITTYFAMNGLSKVDILVMYRKKDIIPFGGAKVMLLSYDDAANNIQKLQEMKPQFVICDEIKVFCNYRSNTTKILTPFLQKIKHIILISSSISPENAKEMFPALKLLKPNVFREFTTFAERYCEGKACSFGLGVEYSGIKNSLELRLILNSLGFSRKKRGEVSTELREKTRKIIPVITETDSKKPPQTIKLKVCKEYLKSLLQIEPKILVFMQSEEFANEISAFLRQNNVLFLEFLPKMPRTIFSEKQRVFHENDLYKVAIISFEVLNSIGTFQGVSLAVFLEISERKEEIWLAEGKLTFSSGKNFVFHYLLAKGSKEEKDFESFMQNYEKNADLEDKRNEFLEFLNPEEKNQEGLIENLDRIEELIRQWEAEERERNKERRTIEKKRKIKEFEEDKLKSEDEVVETDVQGNLLRKKPHFEKPITILE